MALRGTADAEERDDVAAVRVQPEVVAGLFTVERRLAGHLGSNETEGHAEAAPLGAQARGRLQDKVSHVSGHEVDDAEVINRVLVDGPAKVTRRPGLSRQSGGGGIEATSQRARGGVRDREEGPHERALVVTWRTGTYMLAINTAPAAPARRQPGHTLGHLV